MLWRAVGVRPGDRLVERQVVRVGFRRPVLRRHANARDTRPRVYRRIFPANLEGESIACSTGHITANTKPCRIRFRIREFHPAERQPGRLRVWPRLSVGEPEREDSVRVTCLALVGLHAEGLPSRLIGLPSEGLIDLGEVRAGFRSPVVRDNADARLPGPRVLGSVLPGDRELDVRGPRFDDLRCAHRELGCLGGRVGDRTVAHEAAAELGQPFGSGVRKLKRECPVFIACRTLQGLNNDLLVVLVPCRPAQYLIYAHVVAAVYRSAVVRLDTHARLTRKCVLSGVGARHGEREIRSCQSLLVFADLKDRGIWLGNGEIHTLLHRVTKFVSDSKFKGPVACPIRGAHECAIDNIQPGGCLRRELKARSGETGRV